MGFDYHRSNVCAKYTICYMDDDGISQKIVVKRHGTSPCIWFLHPMRDSGKVSKKYYYLLINRGVSMFNILF